MPTERLAPLPPEQQHLLGRAAASLRDEFAGALSAETVDEIVGDSLARLMRSATITTYVPLLVERFARDRLRAVVELESALTDTATRVLFVCTHNALRSQIAAAWLRSLVGDRAIVSSAGSDPDAVIADDVVRAMAEVGIDIADEFPKPLTDEIVRAADVVITMGCGDACAVTPDQRHEDWGIVGAGAHDLASVRAVRDEIRTRVEDLVVTLPETTP